MVHYIHPFMVPSCDFFCLHNLLMCWLSSMPAFVFVDCDSDFVLVRFIAYLLFNVSFNYWLLMLYLMLSHSEFRVLDFLCCFLNLLLRSARQLIFMVSSPVSTTNLLPQQLVLIKSRLSILLLRAIFSWSPYWRLNRLTITVGVMFAMIRAIHTTTCLNYWSLCH